MHAVCETRAFERERREAGMSDDEVESLIDFLASNPDAGDEIVGTGGCRKLRIRGRGKGKSGGFRTITFYSGKHLPVFLITVFSKGERSDLSEAEKHTLKRMTHELVETYKNKVVKVG